MALLSEKAALLVQDKDAVTNLIPEALKLIYNEGLQKTLSTNIRRFGKPHAAENIVKEIIKIAR
jgi:UDP-N-acetylglucosamine--N-acetylmuramyl-(pentapeptide) pyrophosphoryl-undecaprenol N-acetylglucosamine transferase